MTEVAVATPSMRVFLGSPSQVRFVREFVAQAVDGCPVADDVVCWPARLRRTPWCIRLRARAGRSRSSFIPLPGWSGWRSTTAARMHRRISAAGTAGSCGLRWSGGELQLRALRGAASACACVAVSAGAGSCGRCRVWWRVGHAVPATHAGGRASGAGSAGIERAAEVARERTFTDNM